VGQPEIPEDNTYKPKQNQKCWYHDVGTWQSLTSTFCATFQNKLPTIAFNSTIDFDTTAATVSSSLLLDDCSTHALDFSYIFHHTALNSIQTFHAKQAFETEARCYGIMIKHYYADNGLFRTKHFLQDLDHNG
jgi:hypothetical protein